MERDVAALARTPVVERFFALHEPAAAVRPEALLADLDAFLRSYPERMGYQDVFLVSIHGAVLFSGRPEQLLYKTFPAETESQLSDTFERTLTLLATETSDFEHHQVLDEFVSYIGAPPRRSQHPHSLPSYK